MKKSAFFILFVLCAYIIILITAVSCSNTSVPEINVIATATDTDPKVEVVDENGKTLYTTKFDGEGRIVEKVYYKNDKVVMTENNYCYNPEGRINSYRQMKSDNIVTINYSYNQSGNIASRSVVNNTRGNVVEKSMSAVYDENNQKILSSIETDSDGKTVKTTYVYNSKNILMGIVKELPDGNVVKYDYDYGDYNGSFYR